MLPNGVTTSALIPVRIEDRCEERSPSPDEYLSDDSEESSSDEGSKDAYDEPRRIH